jgi:hypothetical protein
MRFCYAIEMSSPPLLELVKYENTTRSDLWARRRLILYGRCQALDARDKCKWDERSISMFRLVVACEF